MAWHECNGITSGDRQPSSQPRATQLITDYTVDYLTICIHPIASCLTTIYSGRYAVSLQFVVPSVSACLFYYPRLFPVITYTVIDCTVHHTATHS